MMWRRDGVGSYLQPENVCSWPVFLTLLPTFRVLRARNEGIIVPDVTMGPVYISDKAVVDLVPYAARHVARRLDVGPFSLLYLAVYLGTLQCDVKEGWAKAVVLVALPALLVCHLLVFLSTQWSVRFMCLVSQRRVSSIDQAEVRYRRLRNVCYDDVYWCTGTWCAGLLEQPSLLHRG